MHSYQAELKGQTANVSLAGLKYCLAAVSIGRFALYSRNVMRCSGNISVRIGMYCFNAISRLSKQVAIKEFSVMSGTISMSPYWLHMRLKSLLGSSLWRS